MNNSVYTFNNSTRLKDIFFKVENYLVSNFYDDEETTLSLNKEDMDLIQLECDLEIRKSNRKEKMFDVSVNILESLNNKSYISSIDSETKEIKLLEL